MRFLLTERETLGMFADLLAYPAGGEADIAAKGAAALSGVFPESAAWLEEVRSFFADTPRERVEEIFTATFDLQASCAPYVGFHLFGEGYKRRIFLAGMNALYASRGFLAEGELPDHIAVVLRFLAVSSADGQTREIVEDGLIPALAKMIRTFQDAGNPYEKVLRALQSVLLLGRPEEDGEGLQSQPETEVRTP